MNPPTPREAFRAGFMFGLVVANILFLALYASLP